MPVDLVADVGALQRRASAPARRSAGAPRARRRPPCRGRAPAASAEVRVAIAAGGGRRRGRRRGRAAAPASLEQDRARSRGALACRDRATKCGANVMADGGGAPGRPATARWRAPPAPGSARRRGRCVADEPVLAHLPRSAAPAASRARGHEFEIDEIRVRRQRRVHRPDRQRAHAARMTRGLVAAGRLIGIRPHGALDRHAVPVEQLRAGSERRGRRTDIRARPG